MLSACKNTSPVQNTAYVGQWNFAPGGSNSYEKYRPFLELSSQGTGRVIKRPCRWSLHNESVIEIVTRYDLPFGLLEIAGLGTVNNSEWRLKLTVLGPDKLEVRNNRGQISGYLIRSSAPTARG